MSIGWSVFELWPEYEGRRQAQNHQIRRFWACFPCDIVRPTLGNRQFDSQKTQLFWFNFIPRCLGNITKVIQVETKFLTKQTWMHPSPACEINVYVLCSASATRWHRFLVVPKSYFIQYKSTCTGFWSLNRCEPYAVRKRIPESILTKILFYFGKWIIMKD